MYRCFDLISKIAGLCSKNSVGLSDQEDILYFHKEVICLTIAVSAIS